MRVPVPAEIPPAEALGRVHFVGIGGAALSGLARIMAGRGLAVTGSDTTDSAMLERLRGLGVTCWAGHAAAHVEGADTVVVSTAIAEDNPEVTRAHELGLRVWPRSAAVQSVLLGRSAIVVTGTHGKTTTASMLATMLIDCGADPSYAIGSTLAATQSNAGNGAGRLFVVEGDESDGAILVYRPVGAVVTNVDVDHLDQFGTADRYAALFRKFLHTVEPGGFVVLYADDPGAAALADPAEALGLRVVTVGQRDSATMRITDLRLGNGGQIDELAGFALLHGDVGLGRVALQVPGAAYAVDAALALAAGLELGYGFAELNRGLAGFRGSARRMELKGVAAGVTVYDSYAHHPTEIAGDLAAARSLAGQGRVVVCFQPHLFSRTRDFGTAMGKALGAADEVVVMDVYPARERPLPGVTGDVVARAVPLPASRVRFAPDPAEVPAELMRRARPGDLVLTLGAGDVTEVGPRVLDLLRPIEEET